MCCRACPGYEQCRAKGKLVQDDCCPQCPYFDSCMEQFGKEGEKPRSPSRRYSRQ